MKETKASRIQRLTARKGELLKELDTLRTNPDIRSERFRVAYTESINRHISRITKKIAELKGNQDA